MLVITRKLNEKIAIRTLNENIEIHILDVGRGRVRLGVNAPQEVRIDVQDKRGTRSMVIPRPHDLHAFPHQVPSDSPQDCAACTPDDIRRLNP